MWMTIATLLIWMLFSTCLWYPWCLDCGPSYTVCSYCPGGDGPTTGYVFTIANIADNSLSPCDCPSYDGTYSVPETTTCHGDACFPATCCFISTSYYEDLRIGWDISDLGSGNWRLTVTVLCRRQTACCGSSSTTWMSAQFTLDKTASDNCYDLSAESMTLGSNSYLSIGGSEGCDPSGMTCSVTAY